jgi:acetoin utilization deacetylase AcuC-like enzyme
MLKARHTTGLVFFPAFDWAISPTHPEREERLLYTQDQVMEEGVFDIDGIVEYKPDPVHLRDIQRVHFCVPDVWETTTESHFISAGGAKTLGMAVLEKEVERGFALVRPPGHHAMRVVHGARGFCNINIEAVMVEYLRRAYGIDRVAVIDTDCHHGDGTQDVYWNDPDTLFISMHQDGRTLYPGSGFVDELGGPNAVGKTLNLPLPPMTSEEGFLFVLDNVVLPILDDFKPQLIVNSAGQDNHYTDPITNMNFSAQGYARLTERLKPDIAVLEGGYAIEGALPYVNLGIILSMAGLDYSRVREPDYDPAALRQASRVTEAVEKVSEAVMGRWENRKDLQEAMRSGRQYSDRARNVFYDTEMLMEQQKERVRVCDDCAGAVRIDSASDRNWRVLCVQIPRKACAACRSAAEEWFHNPDPRIYRRAFLQDRDRDKFTSVNL